jgi:hypothetical protein
MADELRKQGVEIRNRRQAWQAKQAPANSRAARLLPAPEK